MTRTNLTKSCWIVALLSLGAFPATAICQEKAAHKSNERSARNQFASAIEHGQVILHQPGGGIGISTWLFIYPAEDLVIALLSNVPTGPMGGRTHREIAKAFLKAMGRKE